MRYVYILGSAFAAITYIAGDVLQSPMNQIRALFMVAFLAFVAGLETCLEKKWK